jgi:hypothetical protein
VTGKRFVTLASAGSAEKSGTNCLYTRPPPEDFETQQLYLDNLERVLTGVDNRDPPILDGPMKFDMYKPNVRRLGLDWPKTALTMIGSRRLHNFRRLIERVIRNDIPGDIIETGVWRGGASIMARAVLKAWNVTDRKIIVCDSFQGLPPPNVELWPADHDSNLHTYPDLAVSLEQVQANFTRHGLLDEQVVFLKGWFRDTMPQVPSSTLAVIRLDGDMYESTIDPLNHLYDRLSPGGWLIIDDYSIIPACKAAVQDFFGRRGIKPKLRPIDHCGMCMRKD